MVASPFFLNICADVMWIKGYLCYIWEKTAWIKAWPVLSQKREVGTQYYYANSSYTAS